MHGDLCHTTFLRFVAFVVDVRDYDFFLLSVGQGASTTLYFLVKADCATEKNLIIYSRVKLHLVVVTEIVKTCNQVVPISTII